MNRNAAAAVLHARMYIYIWSLGDAMAVSQTIASNELSERFAAVQRINGPATISQ